MIIAMAADHGGYELQNAIKSHLEERGYEITDLGVTDANNMGAAMAPVSVRIRYIKERK